MFNIEVYVWPPNKCGSTLPSVAGSAYSAPAATGVMRLSETKCRR